MFAIQFALILCNCISMIPAVPAIINSVDSDKFHTTTATFFNTMPLAADLPLLSHPAFEHLLAQPKTDRYCQGPVSGREWS